MIFRLLTAGMILVLCACGHGPVPDAAYNPNAPARTPVGRTAVLETGGARIVTHTLGDGPEIVMFASAGREASDFNELAEGLAADGFRVTLLEAPGIRGAKASAETPTLFDLAADIGLYLKTREGPVIVIGHAFGNRLARAVATQHPGKVRGAVLLAAGGLKPIPPDAAKALRDSFDPRLSPEAHRAAVRYGFFAEGNPVPDYWLRGWHIATGELQGAATRATGSRLWWTAAGKPMLVISGLKDTIAPPEDTVDLLEAELGGQVTAVRIAQAGHALLPEAPEEIRAAIRDWLAALETPQAKTSP